MNRKNPSEVIQSCRANIQYGDNLFADAMLMWVLIDRSMHACQSPGDLDTEIFCKSNTDHGIACINLMTQTNHFNCAMAVDRITNTNHWIGKVDKPRIGTRLLHIMGDSHDRTDVARRVSKAARSPVFA